MGLRLFGAMVIAAAALAMNAGASAKSLPRLSRAHFDCVPCWRHHRHAGPHPGAEARRRPGARTL